MPMNNTSTVYQPKLTPYALLFISYCDMDLAILCAQCCFPRKTIGTWELCANMDASPATAKDTVTLRFSVGKKYVLLTFQLPASSSYSTPASTTSPTLSMSSPLLPISASSPSLIPHSRDHLKGSNNGMALQNQHSGTSANVNPPINLKERVKAMLTSERGPLKDIPVYLHVPILSALHELQKEEAALCPVYLSEAVLDTIQFKRGADQWAESFCQHHHQWMVCFRDCRTVLSSWSTENKFRNQSFFPFVLYVWLSAG